MKKLYPLNKITLIGLSFMMGCGNMNEGFIEDEFKSYVEDFESKMNVKVSGVNVTFKPTDKAILALCIVTNNVNEIHVNREGWIKASDSGKEQIIFHELGHCVLYLDHNDTRVVRDRMNVEGSIMNTYWFGYKAHYTKLKSEYHNALKVNTIIGTDL